MLVICKTELASTTNDQICRDNFITYLRALYHQPTVHYDNAFSVVERRKQTPKLQYSQTIQSTDAIYTHELVSPRESGFNCTCRYICLCFLLSLTFLHNLTYTYVIQFYTSSPRVSPKSKLLPRLNSMGTFEFLNFIHLFLNSEFYFRFMKRRL